MNNPLRARRLLASGLSRAEIAQRLNVTPQAVSYMLPEYRPGAGRPAVAQAVRDEAARLAREGLSYRLIAEQLGIGVGTAHKYATAGDTR